MIEIDVEITNKWYGYKAIIYMDCQGSTRRIVVRARTIEGLASKVRLETGLTV